MDLESILRASTFNPVDSGIDSVIGRDKALLGNSQTLEQILTAQSNRGMAEQKHPLAMTQMGLQNTGLGLKNDAMGFDNKVNEGIGVDSHVAKFRNELGKQEDDKRKRTDEAIGEIGAQAMGMPPGMRQQYISKRLMDMNAPQHMIDAISMWGPEDFTKYAQRQTAAMPKNIAASEQLEARLAMQQKLKDKDTEVKLALAEQRIASMERMLAAKLASGERNTDVQADAKVKAAGVAASKKGGGNETKLPYFVKTEGERISHKEATMSGHEVNEKGEFTTPEGWKAYYEGVTKRIQGKQVTATESEIPGLDPRLKGLVPPKKNPAAYPDFKGGQTTSELPTGDKPAAPANSGWSATLKK